MFINSMGVRPDTIKLILTATFDMNIWSAFTKKLINSLVAKAAQWRGWNMVMKNKYINR